MYNEFTINEILINPQTKTISVNFAYDIDPTSITEETIQVMDRSTREIIDYDVIVDDRIVNITLKSWPEPNKEYLLTIEKLKNILGDVLASAIRKKIIFTSSITSTVNILNPDFNEVINDIFVKWEEVKADETQELVNSYFIEISSDTNFYNIERATLVQEKQEIILEKLEPGQYFIRMRVQKNEQYGFWSEKVSFIIETNSNDESGAIFDEDNNNPVFIQEIKLLCSPENGDTPETILLEFDCPINSDFLENIIVIRKEM